MRSLAVAVVTLLACFAAACSNKPEASPTATVAVSPTGTATLAATLTRPTLAPTLSGAAPPATVQPRSERELGSPTGAVDTFSEPGFQPLPGARAVFGRLGAALYRIETPAQWNGDLVLYAHGVRLENNVLTVSNPPAALRKALIDGGFAWAASSYSENQYVPGIGADDTLALADHFTASIGAPKRTYIVGESMGGHVLTLLMEQFPARFDGGLALCGAVGGEEEIDFLISWAMVAEYTSGVKLPLEAGSNLTEVLIRQVAPALGTPDAPTARGKQFLSIVRELTGGARPFFIEGMRERYTLNFGLLLIDPARKSLPAAAATNAGAVYAIAPGLGVTSAEVNAAVRRLAADPAARDAHAHADAVPTSGRIERPVLSLHTTGDLFVPISLEVEYRRKVEAAGRGDLLVQRAIRAPGHCQFSDAELTAAWSDLAAWVRDGKKPAGDDVLGDLANIGRTFTNPLRPGDPGTP